MKHRRNAEGFRVFQASARNSPPGFAWLRPRPRSVPVDTQYWVLKTTVGGGEDKWPKFQAEGVLAVGWAEISVDPAAVDYKTLRDAVAAVREDDPAGVATKLKKFVSMKNGDLVLICRGYTPNQKKDVHIYGLARVTGPFRDDRGTTWHWRFKHEAVIQTLGIQIAKADLVQALNNMESLRETIHALDQIAWDRLAALLRRSGIQVEV